MSEEAPHLRVVGPGESTRRRRPGPALLFILLYALLFGGALWYLGVRSDLFRKKEPSLIRRENTATRGRGTPALSRDALLAGEGIAEPARSRYFRRLATERCDCGCGRTLSDCLANEKSCSRSSDLAGRLIQDSRFKIQN